MPGYLIRLNARLYEMKRLLKKTGSILVHCDWHANHYIKVEMDKMFGYHHLQNEIVWSYRSGGGSKKRYGRKHDILFWYSKDRRAGWPTSSRGGGHDDRNTNIKRQPIVKAPPSKKVRHPPECQ